MPINLYITGNKEATYQDASLITNGGVCIKKNLVVHDEIVSPHLVIQQIQPNINKSYIGTEQNMFEDIYTQNITTKSITVSKICFEKSRELIELNSNKLIFNVPLYLYNNKNIYAQFDPTKIELIGNINLNDTLISNSKKKITIDGDLELKEMLLQKVHNLYVEKREIQLNVYFNILTLNITNDSKITLYTEKTNFFLEIIVLNKLFDNDIEIIYNDSSLKIKKNYTKLFFTNKMFICLYSV